MGVQTLHLRKALGSGSDPGKRGRVAFNETGALQEIEHPQARRVARRSRRRQDVIGSGDIIANRFRSPSPEKDRAGMADSPRQPFRLGHGDFKMLRRQAVDQRRCLIERLQDNDHAMLIPALPGDRLARQRDEVTLHSGFDGVGEAGIIADQD